MMNPLKLLPTLTVFWLALANLGQASNTIRIDETFYKLHLNEQGTVVDKTEIRQAKAGDVIELRIRATHLGNQPARNLALINRVPTAPSQLIANSFQWDATQGDVQLSLDGQLFFPMEADLPSAQITHIQWLIDELQPKQYQEVSYQLRLPETITISANLKSKPSLEAAQPIPLLSPLTASPLISDDIQAQPNTATQDRANEPEGLSLLPAF